MKFHLLLLFKKTVPGLLLFNLCFGPSFAQVIHRELPVGEIIDSVRCQTDPSLSYAAYLPSNYDSNKRWPIIYLFEPMARGRLPIELYAEVADRRGYILICSNNSRNGSVAKSLDIFNALENDTENRFSIDPNRIYTSGFSGGARFAQFLANTQEQITGVIAVAGPKLESRTNGKQYLYYGIVGSRDMNYIEHHDFQNELDKNEIKNLLMTYLAPHRWAPAREYEIALEWLDVQHKLSSGNEITDQGLAQYLSKEILRVDTLDGLSMIDKYEYLTGLRKSVATFEYKVLDEKIEMYRNNKDLQKNISRRQRLFKKERQSYQIISSALYQLKVSSYDTSLPLDSTSYPLSWWKQTIRDLQGKVKRADERGDIAARTLDVIRGQVFGVGLQTDAEDNIEYKLNLSRIQTMLYPHSVWVLWNQAVIFAQKKDEKSALGCLKKANQINDVQLYSLKESQKELANQFPYLFE